MFRFPNPYNTHFQVNTSKGLVSTDTLSCLTLDQIKLEGTCSRTVFQGCAQTTSTLIPHLIKLRCAGIVPSYQTAAACYVQSDLVSTATGLTAVELLSKEGFSSFSAAFIGSVLTTPVEAKGLYQTYFPKTTTLGFLEVPKQVYGLISLRNTLFLLGADEDRKGNLCGQLSFNVASTVIDYLAITSLKNKPLMFHNLQNITKLLFFGFARVAMLTTGQRAWFQSGAFYDKHISQKFKFFQV